MRGKLCSVQLCSERAAPSPAHTAWNKAGVQQTFAAGTYKENSELVLFNEL